MDADKELQNRIRLINKQLSYETNNYLSTTYLAPTELKAITERIVNDLIDDYVYYGNPVRLFHVLGFVAQECSRRAGLMVWLEDYLKDGDFDCFPKEFLEGDGPSSEDDKGRSPVRFIAPSVPLP